MYPKAKHGESQCASRSTKRHFQGNQYMEKSDETEQSTSAKKLKTAISDNIVYNPQHTYRIIEYFTVFTTLAQMLICKECKKSMQFEETGIRGFGFKLIVKCTCGRTEINSGPLIHTGYEINRRLVFVLRLLGIGREGINIFSGLMDIGQGIAIGTYDRIVRHMHEVAKSVFDHLTEKVVDEEKAENVKNERPPTELKISGDGSWKKRGFTSLFGVTTIIGYYSGKVIDLVVKSSYCQACVYWRKKEDTDEYTEWYEEHENECFANHSGSAGKMEVDAMKEMFSRSEEKFKVKYTNYIGDGDSKTFNAILNLNPYGDDVSVIKTECVGHVEKRMGTRLRNAKKTHKLGGKGKLTDVLIKKLTKYYGLAIRRNVNSVPNMKKAIWATLEHLCSSNENPRHDNCPAGADSWCQWRKYEATGKLEEYDHPPPLHPDIEEHLIPIYTDLSNEDLLTRCMGGHTQNANESFNATVWRLAPKHLNSGKNIIEIAAFIAAGIFNEGYSSLLKMMNQLEINIGPECRNFANMYDTQRISRQERRRLSSTKEARAARRLAQITTNEFHEEAEGLLYGAGIAD
ncbi:hypothetical protein X777_16771 [Ooceraea biroi]|uniref:Mutator-like transposase domain-containing protein n=2 Tax=Ooceraea biroi TaxID=2015173 RepID=A0A026VW76_OOCBI|nr:hypothetical protein X777_16771 [Ooceraea biroi]